MKLNPYLGALIYLCIYAVATVTFLPGSILTLGAGFAFKASLGSLWKALLFGTFCVEVGASIGAIIAFLLGRFVLQDWVKKKSEKFPILKAI
jgi:uncharacterized membrane protein YdjX (TVP38/TMEM64 family)